jgi:hypothetical protein
MYSYIGYYDSDVKPCRASSTASPSWNRAWRAGWMTSISGGWKQSSSLSNITTAIQGDYPGGPGGDMRILHLENTSLQVFSA